MAKNEQKYSFEVTGDIGYGFGSKEYVAQKLKDNEKKPVCVRVNSLGGSVDDALDIVARFQEHGDVTVHMKGMNASAATILAMGAKRICMDKNGLMLIHNCLNVVWELGWMNANEIQEAMERMRKQAEDQAVVDRVIASIYANRSGKSFEEIKQVMDRGGWLTADDCLELGLIDEILDVDADDRRTVAVARASFDELQLAYGLPSLPDPTPLTKVQDTIDSFNLTMKKFVNSILALFAIEAIADNASEEQVQDAINGVTAQINDLKDQLKAAQDEAVQLKADMEAQKAAHEQALNDQKEAMQKTIDEQAAQIHAMQSASAAEPQAPQAGNEPQEPQDKDPLEGLSAKEIFNLV